MNAAVQNSIQKNSICVIQDYRTKNNKIRCVK